MVEKDNKLYLVDEDGKEKEYDILLTFDVEENDNQYVVYTDNEKDEDSFIKTYAGYYSNSDDKKVLYPVENDAEWALIEKLLEKLDKEDEKSDEE